MTWFRAGGGNGVPAALKSEMNDVLNKKFGTSTDYPPNDWPDTVDLMGPLEEKTVSGSIASFSDGADDVPIKSLVASLPASLTPYEEIKISHTGKNLIETPQFDAISLCFDFGRDITVDNITFSFVANGTISATNTAALIDYRKEDGTHGYKTLASFYDDNNVRWVNNTQQNGRFSNVSQNMTFRYIYIYYTTSRLGYSAFNADNITNWQVEIGSSASDYEAYQEPETYNIDIPNPNPDIFNFAESSYQRGAWKADGTVDPNEWSCRAYKIPIESGATYDIFGEGFYTLVTYFDANDTFISSETLTKTADFHEAVTIPANCAYLGVSYEGFFVMETKYIKKAFNVYGGSIEAISGEGTSTHNIIDLGTLTWTYHPATASYEAFFDSYLPDDSITGDSTVAFDGYTDDYKSIPSSLIALPNQPQYDDMVMALAKNTRRIIICDTRYTTAADFTAALNGVYLSYPLETAANFQVSQIAVNSKAGYNNIWNDAGDTEITYRSQGTTTPILPDLITKSISENGTYTAADEGADGFSEVTVNVESIVKIGINSGKLNITNGTITADNTYCYTEPFECPSGIITLDVGEGTISDYAGIELIYESDGSHANYWQGSSRFREVDLTNYYAATKKARLAFKKQYLSKLLLMDFGNGKIYSSLTAAQFEETQTE